jgi:hypothetical protein
LAVVYLAAEALHIVLVPVLMFGLGPLPPLGITGAGIATVASFTASSAASPGTSFPGGSRSGFRCPVCGLTGTCSWKSCASARRCRCSRF